MRPPSSMVVEFSDKHDLKQACYEATVDLNLYIIHLEGIAKRAQKNFPEVAAGLHGTADGIKQYLRGVDGEWQTPANSVLRLDLPEADFKIHQWAYEFCRDPRAAVLLYGCCSGVAAAKPPLNFWDTMRVARAKLADLEPLVEKLLASSPQRKAQ